MRKQIIGLIALCAAAFAARGAESDWAGSFYTVGPDRYADGSEVLPDEEYVLVWQKNGTAFAGFREDGALVDAENSVRLNVDRWHAEPRKKGGCELKRISITLDPSYLQTGSLSLYVLDTRRFSGHVYDAASGELLSVSTNVTSASAAKAVQGYAEVAAYAAVVQTGGSTTAGTTEGKTYFLSTIDNAVIESPVITGMRFEGDFVVLTVASTNSKLTYDAVGSDCIGTATGASATSKAVAPVSGAATSKDAIEIRVRRDAAASSQFFRVIRRQL